MRVAQASLIVIPQSRLQVFCVFSLQDPSFPVVLFTFNDLSFFPVGSVVMIPSMSCNSVLPIIAFFYRIFVFCYSFL